MKNLILIFSLLFSFSKISHAQDAQKVDSLLTIYNDSNSADTLKMKVLNQLFSAHLYYDQEKANNYLSKFYDLAREIGNDSDLASYFGNKGILFDIMGQIDSSRIYYKKAINIFEKNGNRTKLTLVRFNLGMIEHGVDNYQAAINLMEKNVLPESQISEENAPSQAMSYGLLGRVYSEMGYYQLALENALTALRIVETTGDELRQADALRDLAQVESFLAHYQKSIDYNLQAIALYKKHDDRYFLAGAKNVIGSTYFVIKDYKSALRAHEEALSLAQEMGSVDAETSALLNLGKVNMEQGNFELAQKYLEDALTIFEKNQSIARLHETNFQFGNLYAKFGQPSKALIYFNQLVADADSIQENHLLQDIYFERAQTYEDMGNYKLALSDYKKFHSLSDSIYDAKKIMAIEELRTIHDLEQKEKEITLLAKNAELEKVKSTRLWISLAAVIGIGSILLYAQWLRRRKEKEIENEKQKVAELENQKLNYELNFKKQELTSKVLQLCRKNEFLQSLEKEVKEFKSESEGTERHRLEKLSRKINRDIEADTDWEQFLKSFESVHPDFKKLVVQKHPDLTSNEMRIAYLMYMNLDSKNIASLLNITSEGVKKARQRMRKKLNIDSSVRLQDYFMSFGIPHVST
ncbi:MAG: tetratricopeptide repeat protein [Bacteroidota bacterium]